MNRELFETLRTCNEAEKWLHEKVGYLSGSFTGNGVHITGEIDKIAEWFELTPGMFKVDLWSKKCKDPEEFKYEISFVMGGYRFFWLSREDEHEEWLNYNAELFNREDEKEDGK